MVNDLYIRPQNLNTDGDMYVVVRTAEPGKKSEVIKVGSYDECYEFIKNKNLKKMEINKKYFYDTIKKEGLYTRLSQSQVDGMNYILTGFEASGLKDLRWLAYMLATTYHETAKTMQPIEEYGKGRNRKYGKKIKMNGSTYSTPDKIYYGRGYVQLTWYENYEQMGKALGFDLLNNPELALQPEIAMRIMIEGMTLGLTNRGDFTGKSLEDYFNSKVENPREARRIINGTDKADLIADYYSKFKRSLSFS